MSRLDRFRRIAKESRFEGERDNARRFADRLAGKHSDRAKAAAAALNENDDYEPGHWREADGGKWTCDPAPNHWGIPSLPLVLTDDRMIAQAEFELGKGYLDEWIAANGVPAL